MPTCFSSGRSKCFCGAPLTLQSVDGHIEQAYMDRRTGARNCLLTNRWREARSWAMATEQPLFNVRQSFSGYIVEVVWPDGRTETAWGVHDTREAAAEWVRHRSKLWLEQRLGRI
jgi:hypothetical protein